MISNPDGWVRSPRGYMPNTEVQFDLPSYISPIRDFFTTNLRLRIQPSSISETVSQSLQNGSLVNNVYPQHEVSGSD